MITPDNNQQSIYVAYRDSIELIEGQQKETDGTTILGGIPDLQQATQPFSMAVAINQIFALLCDTVMALPQ